MVLGDLTTTQMARMDQQAVMTIVRCLYTRQFNTCL